MKTKTIIANNPIEFDKKVNEFSEKNKVKFTQTHVTALSFETSVTAQYTAVLYYEE